MADDRQLVQEVPRLVNISHVTRAGGVFALLATALVGGACGRGDLGANAAASTDSGGTAQSGAESFYKTGLAGISTDLAIIHEDFGDPDSTHVTAVKNRHVPTQTDSLITRHYKGFDVVVYRISTDGKELLSAVRVMDNKYINASSPIRVGIAEDDLAMVMGTPTESNDTIHTYVCATCTQLGNDRIELRRRQGLITAITIFYPID